jgi:dihydrofolate reductase
MVSIIVAIAQNGTIGDKNSLLWHIKEDMRFFRTTTSGHAVIMGRKTFESLGSKPLPKRKNIVITRADRDFEGAFTAHSLEEAIAMAKAESGDEEIFIIGGAQIYAEALSVADRMYITRVERDYEGDTSFPEIDFSQWRLVSEERHERGEEFDAPFAFLCYDRA